MSYIGNTNTTQAFIPAIDYFSGNGSTTAFTLSRPVASVAQVQVTIDNVAQNPSSAFTVSGNTITFTSAPLSGSNNIYVYYTSPITQVIAPSQGTVDATSLASSTGTGSVVLATSPTITTPTINSISSASATALTLKSAGTTAITVDASQQVGIGGTPVKTLSILPTSIRRMDFYVRDPGVDDALVIRSQNATNNNIRDMILEGSFLRFFTGADSGGSGSERMRINSAGYLKASNTGTYQSSTSSNHELRTNSGSDFSTYITNSNASTPYGLEIQFTGAAPNNTSQSFCLAEDTANLRFVVMANGGIKNYSANNVNLSDQREKTNFAPSKSYLNTICSIPVQTFNYIDQNLEEDDGLTLGVIAQDVQEVAPELVKETDWGTKEEPKMRLSIYQTDLQYALMKSIQELKAINDTQAETINALTARIVALENR